MRAGIPDQFNRKRQVAGRPTVARLGPCAPIYRRVGCRREQDVRPRTMEAPRAAKHRKAAGAPSLCSSVPGRGDACSVIFLRLLHPTRPCALATPFSSAVAGRGMRPRRRFVDATRPPCHLPRRARRHSRQPGARRSTGQRRDRGLHRLRGDVDHPAPTPCRSSRARATVISAMGVSMFGVERLDEFLRRQSDPQAGRRAPRWSPGCRHRPHSSNHTRLPPSSRF